MGKVKESAESKSKGQAGANCGAGGFSGALAKGQAGAEPPEFGSAACRKGQVSAEFMTIFGILALLVLVFLSLSMQRMSDITKQQAMDDARFSAQALADAADFVYVQGEGATKLVTIRLPLDTNFSQTYIGRPAGSNVSPNTVCITVLGNNFLAETDADLNGTFPNATGTYNMRAVSHKSYVSISRHIFDLDKYSVSISMGRNLARSETIHAYSATAEAVPVSVEYDWNYNGIVNLSVSNTSATDFQINVTSGSGAGGIYSTQLIFIGNSSGTIERIGVPVSIDVWAG